MAPLLESSLGMQQQLETCALSVRYCLKTQESAWACLHCHANMCFVQIDILVTP